MYQDQKRTNHFPHPKSTKYLRTGSAKCTKFPSVNWGMTGIRASLHTSVVPNRIWRKHSKTFNSNANCDWTADKTSVRTYSLAQSTQWSSSIKKIIKHNLGRLSKRCVLHDGWSAEQCYVVLFKPNYKTYLNFHHPFNSLDFCLTEGTSVFSTHIRSHSQVGRLICYLQVKNKKINKTKQVQPNAVHVH